VITALGRSPLRIPRDLLGDVGKEALVLGVLNLWFLLPESYVKRAVRMVGGWNWLRIVSKGSFAINKQVFFSLRNVTHCASVRYSSAVDLRHERGHSYRPVAAHRFMWGRFMQPQLNDVIRNHVAGSRHSLLPTAYSVVLRSRRD
jgi:hypothetical protein